MTVQPNSTHKRFITRNQRVYGTNVLPCLSDSALSFTLARLSKNFITKQQQIEMTENAIINSMAITYLGPSDSGKKYGLQMLPSCESRFCQGQQSSAVDIKH